MNGDYSSEDVLTAADVPGFPNGTATVYRVRVADDPANRRVLATLDARGILRTLNEKRAVFPIDSCGVVEVVE